MPKSGDVIRGRYTETIGSGPIVWDDTEPKTFFTIPSSEEPDDDAARITKAFAAAAAQGQERARRERLAKPVTFIIPSEEN